MRKAPIQEILAVHQACRRKPYCRSIFFNCLIVVLLASQWLIAPSVHAVPGDESWDEQVALSGVDGTVGAILSDGAGSIYVGGGFSNAGGVPVGNIARWDGSSWSALGLGVNGKVNALVMDSNGMLYAGGFFTQAGGASANYIARWDGINWTEVGIGVDSFVWSLAFDDSNGVLYAGGDFSTAGGNAVGRVAQWDGSNWSALDSGVSATVFALTIDSTGVVYAGGDFSSAGGNTAHGIAQWDGSTWSALGSGLNSNARLRVLLLDSNDDLYVGGSYSTAGVNSTNHIARWDGSAWSALDSGVSAFGFVEGLAWDSDGNLFVGGAFDMAGSVSANNIAKWDGNAWSALGSGVNGFLSSVMVDRDNSVYVGGSLSLAGGNASMNFAYWGPPAIVSPANGSNFSDTTQLFEWTANVPDVTDWWLYLGSDPDSFNYYNSGSLPGTDLQATVTDLPINGGTIYAKLWYKTNADTTWRFINTLYGTSGNEPAFDSPLPGAQLSGAVHTFSWFDSTPTATNYWLDVGSGVGLNDYYSSGALGPVLSNTAVGLPNDGASIVYVRLWYRVGSGAWLYIDAEYVAGTGSVFEPAIVGPMPGTVLAGTSDTFSWSENGSGASQYWGYWGSVQGGNQYASMNVGGALSAPVDTLPENGSTVWFRLWYRSGPSAGWQFIDTSYTASGSGPVITSHSSGDVLGSPTDTFTWSDSSGMVSGWWVYIGSTPGGLQYDNSANLGVATNYLSNALPTGGGPVFVRLWYKEGSGDWKFVDQMFTAAP